MKRISLVLVIVLSLCSSVLLAQEWSAAQKEVWGAEENLYAALQRGDVEGLLSMLHPDYRGLHHGTSVPIDKATFRKGAEAGLKNIKITFLSNQPLSIQVFGNAAVVHYISVMLSKGPDGKESPEQTEWTDVLTRQGDRWLIIADNGNSLPETPVTTASSEVLRLYREAVVKAENAEVTRATALIDSALQQEPNFVRGHLLHAGLVGNSDLALKDIAKAVALKNSVSLGEQMLIAYYDNMAHGQTARAKPYLDSLLLLWPNGKRVQTLAADYYISLGDIATAITHLEQAVRLDPNLAAAHNQLGYLYLQTGKTDAAEKSFKTYVTLLPDAPNSHDSYGECLRINGRYEESIAEYQKALALDPGFGWSMRGLGDCYLKQGDLKKALAQYQVAEEKSAIIGDRAAAYYKHAMAHVVEGNIPEALAALEELKAFNLKEKQNFDAVFAVLYEAYALSAFGKAPEARKKLQEAAELVKSLNLAEATRDILLARIDLLQAYSYLDEKNLSKAKENLAAFQKAVARLQNAGLELMLKGMQGCLAMREGNLDEAINKLTAVPENPFVLHALAVAYTSKGDKEKAKAALEKLSKWQSLNLDWAIESRQAAMNRGI